jgi:hypothetical protein
MTQSKLNLKVKIGILLMVLSVTMFLFLFVTPFLNLEKNLKIGLSTLWFVLGEVFFWAGALLLGKELVNKYKYQLNPVNWFKKK